MKHILFCKKCDQYTMQETCPKCSAKTEHAKPPKYSPADKYGKYRREVKEEERKEKDLI